MRVLGLDAVFLIIQTVNTLHLLIISLLLLVLSLLSLLTDMKQISLILRSKIPIILNLLNADLLNCIGRLQFLHNDILRFILLFVLVVESYFHAYL